MGFPHCKPDRNDSLLGCSWHKLRPSGKKAVFKNLNYPDTSHTFMDIILLGHGSRRGKDTALGLEEIRRRLQLKFDNGCRVRMAGLEFTPPSLEEAVLKLAEEGSKDIVIMPFFLFRGKHLKEEIPQDIDRIQSMTPQVSLRLIDNLGPDSRLMDLVEERLREFLPGSKNAGVILVRRGSRPEYDSGEELLELAKDISRRTGFPVEPAQAQFGYPTIAEAIQSLNMRSPDKIIVMPYLFFPGKVLYDNIIVDVNKARESYPHVEFCITSTLGVDDRLVDIARDKIQNAEFKFEGV